MTPVAVTGIGVVSAFGIGVEPFWDGLVAGRSALAPPTRLGTPGVVCAGEVRALAPRDFVRSAVGRRIDRTSLLALAACRLALADAGAPLDGLDPTRFGLALGSAFGNFGETTGFLDRLFARGAGNPLVFPNLVLNAGLSYASIELGVTGPTACLTEQEASGEAAIAWGGRLVADGAADVILAGAADELDGTLCEVLRDAGLMAAGAPRPFDPGADGTAPGEGAAVVVLEPLARARARKARIYARLGTHPGFAVPAPVHGWPSDPGPLATGLGPLLADVELVVASACGYPARDGLEGAALVRALAGRRVAVTAPRAAVGDFGSAGALGVAVAALAVYTGVVPPTLGVNGNGPRGLDVVTGAARRGPVRVAAVLGLARGGVCRPLRLEAV